MFCKYECGYGSEDCCKNPNHMRPIKHGCLAHFSIKRLYTWLDVVEITFTIKFIPEPMEIVLMVHVTQGLHQGCRHKFPRVSHKLKEFIWTQLGLRYTVKQIYDKHKKNWWAQVNVGERMTWDDFL
jgi:hypothetical protein